MRGVGFIHSPLLQKSGYVSQQMLHVCDWLPTLYEAAGGNPKSLKHLDGTSAWQMLSTDGDAIRSEMLHNIDPIGKFAGIRVGGYKLVTGNIGHGYNDWYPQWQLAGDEHRLHADHFHSDALSQPASLSSKGEPAPSLRQALRVSRANSRSQQDVRRTVEKMSEEKMSAQVQRSSGPVTVDCGPKPANASTNCQPEKSPCLFHIPSDPCEYNNIAASHPDIVSQLLLRLMNYTYTMIPPGNKPTDDRGNPKYHNNTDLGSVGYHLNSVAWQHLSLTTAALRPGAVPWFSGYINTVTWTQA